MIKIIKKGTIETCNCETCGCVFSYEKEDIETKMTPYSSFEGIKIITKYIICPQCSNMIVLEATK